MSAEIDIAALQLSVIIPAFNEEKRILPALQDIADFFSRYSITHEIIVVDDGSRDRTVEVVKEFAHPRIRVHSLPTNTGKGAAVRAGMLLCHGQYLMYCDADGSTPFTEVVRLLSAIEKGADIAIGSRAIFAQDTSVSTVWYRKFMGRTFNALVNLLILPGLSDTQCGFKLFRRKAALDIFCKQKSSGFSFDVELLFLGRRFGYKIVELPVNWINVPGSKVDLIRDSTRMLRDIIWFRWLYLRGAYKD